MDSIGASFVIVALEDVLELSNSVLNVRWQRHHIGTLVFAYKQCDQ